MPVQALTQVDPKQFLNLPLANGAGIQRLDTQVTGVAVSNDLLGRLSVTTAEGDKITLTADLEARYQAVGYQGQTEANGGNGRCRGPRRRSLVEATVWGDGRGRSERTGTA